MVKLQTALVLGSALLGTTPALAAPSHLDARQNGDLRENIVDVLRDTAKRNCLLDAFAGMQNRNGGTNSWEEVAGIHGLSTGRGQFRGDDTKPALGWCAHMNSAFPTWHRRYLQMFENAGRTSCSSFRLPYWDSARDDLPAEFQTETITWGSNPRPRPNPLYAYRFDGDRNATLPGGGAQSWSQTLRQPSRTSNGGYQSNDDVAAGACSRLQPQLTQKLFSMFTRGRQNWDEFSNKALDNNNGGRDPDTNYDSIETIHDNIHTALGGDEGHMTYTSVAAYDPLFWLHHCNVDRLFAMWQARYPRVAVADDTLNPWGGDASSVTSVSDLGYNYADAQGNVEATITRLYCTGDDCALSNSNTKRGNKDCDDTVTHTVKTVGKSTKITHGYRWGHRNGNKGNKKKYTWKSSSWVDFDDWKNVIRGKVYKKGSDTRNKYTCRVRTSSKAMNKTYRILFFGGETCQDKKWSEKKAYDTDDFIGMYSPFGSSGQGTNMPDMKEVTIGGTVHLDAATYNWIGAGKLGSTDEDEVVSYLKKNMCFKIVDSKHKEYEAKDIEGLGIDVIVTPVTKSKKQGSFPKYGKNRKCLTIY